MSDENVKDGDPNTKGDDLSKEVEQLKKENFTLREQRRSLNSRIEDLENSSKTKEEDALKNANNYKQLYENTKKDLDALKEENTSFRTREVEGKKNKAILQELNSIGFDSNYMDEAFKLMDRSKVVVDNETGSVIGASDLVRDFAERYKEYPFFKKATSKVNHGTSRYNMNTNIGGFDVRGKTRQEIRDHYKAKRASMK